MEEEIATNYDVVILGTGFTESLLAAACARVGKKVLHIDRNSYYGGKWASFSLTNFEEWVSNPLNSDTELNQAKVKPNEKVLKLSDPNTAYSKTKQTWHLSETVPESDGDANPLSRANLSDLSRKFNIDLAPKVLFSRGKLVDLLISSNVARYVEFKCITRILTWMEESEGEEKRLVVVPCSRSDVFTTEVVSLIEKRLLMKFLEFCHSFEKNEQQWDEFKDKSFNEFLEMHKLTPKLMHFVTNAIAMVDGSVSCREGLEKTAIFLKSLGRYGNMPFLFSLYGSGEMPQAFCRLCAVFDGIYMLRSAVEGIVMENDVVTAITTKEQRFDLKHIVMEASYAMPTFAKVTQHTSISRGVFITDKSLFPSEKEQLTVLRFPSDENTASPVTVYELGQATGVCPPDTYVVHLTCSGFDAENDLKKTVECLFGPKSANNPKILYEAYFNQEVSTDLEKSDAHPSNLHLCSGPDGSLDYDSAIESAQEIFKKIFPDEDFLPRAPDPDEIVFDNDGVEPKEGDNFEKKDSTEEA